MAAKQQLAPKWASLFRLGENYNFYSRCQSFIQAFSDAGLRNDKPGPRTARVLFAPRRADRDWTTPERQPTISTFR